jgi:hypothetical protein
MQTENKNESIFLVTKLQIKKKQARKNSGGDTILEASGIE